MDRRHTDSRGGVRGRHVLRAVALLAILGSAAAAAALLARSHREGQDALEARFAARAVLSAQAVDTYTTQLMDRELITASASMMTGTDGFGPATRAFGFTNAVLLDAQGRVLAVQPDNPAVVGTRIAGRYPHLKAALGGARSASPVVSAAADGARVVGFAVPFDTPSGRRVFSGAYDVRATPLTEYIHSLVSLRGSRFYLVDEDRRLLTSSGDPGGASTLAQIDPVVAAGLQRQAVGEHEGQFVASAEVDGTPYTVVAAIAHDDLLRPINGAGRLLSWLILAALTATALTVWVLVIRRSQDHARLQGAYARLDVVSQLDGLTGSCNRRATADRLRDAHAEAVRSGTPLTVLMVDVDRFKSINDRYGHLAGDDALVAVAERLQGALREDDVLGRWGGEEFLAVLPATGPEPAAVVAERLRAAVAAEPVRLATDDQALEVTVSIGLASTASGTTSELVHAADQALYAAKAAGRNRVVTGA